MNTNMTRRQSILKSIPLALIGAFILFISALGSSAQRESLPAEISDAAFWAMIEDLSEPGGFFPTENFSSNERGHELLIPKLQATLTPGGAFLGVGPEQNFHYIAALRPKIAFIVDIRRQNMIQHLLYKAAFGLSADRAGFLSRLFSKRLPAGLTKDSTAEQLIGAYDIVESDPAFVSENRGAIQDFLSNRFSLTDDDLKTLDHVFDVFAAFGPNVTYSSSLDPGAAPLRDRNPRYGDLMLLADGNGMNRSYLASEESFNFIKDMERKNLIIPLVGNFGGPKTIRAIGRYLKERDAIVTAFYISNVEQYLFRPPDRSTPVDRNFYESVATLPLDDRSAFIRSGTAPGSASISARMSPIYTILEAYAAGRILNHNQAMSLSTN